MFRFFHFCLNVQTRSCGLITTARTQTGETERTDFYANRINCECNNKQPTHGQVRRPPSHTEITDKPVGGWTLVNENSWTTCWVQFSLIAPELRNTLTVTLSHSLKQCDTVWTTSISSRSTWPPSIFGHWRPNVMETGSCETLPLVSTLHFWRWDNAHSRDGEKHATFLSWLSGVQ